MSRFFGEGSAALLEFFPVVNAEAEEGVGGAAINMRSRDPRARAGDDAPLAVEQRDHVHQHVDEKSLSTTATLKIIPSARTLESPSRHTPVRMFRSGGTEPSQLGGQTEVRGRPQ